MILPTSHEQGKSKDRQFDPHLVVRETASYMQSRPLKTWLFVDFVFNVLCIM